MKGVVCLCTDTSTCFRWLFCGTGTAGIGPGAGEPRGEWIAALGTSLHLTEHQGSRFRGLSIKGERLLGFRRKRGVCTWRKDT